MKLHDWLNAVVEVAAYIVLLGLAAYGAYVLVAPQLAGVH